MPRKNITVAVLAAMIALLLATSANAVSMGPSTLPPYTGVIKNNTACEFSIPSQNSMGTLIVPARGWIEYVVWDPKFEVIPYYKGNPFGCQWVTVTPKAFCLHVQKLRFHGGHQRARALSGRAAVLSEIQKAGAPETGLQLREAHPPPDDQSRGAIRPKELASLRVIFVPAG